MAPDDGRPDLNQDNEWAKFVQTAKLVQRPARPREIPPNRICAAQVAALKRRAGHGACTHTE